MFNSPKRVEVYVFTRRSEEKRKLQRNLVYVVEYKKDGDNVNVTVEMQGFDQPMNFSWTPGVEFEYVGLDGTNMKSTFRWDGSACREEHASVTGMWTSVRTVDGDSMTLTSECNGVSMVEKFKRV
ncbi:uncharacterized protein LOC124266171 isoform X2 [Haliotis rubra]|uniref:uncharacterized protein LOC124266171 isoform X2 n=1 Tax=Haliotis rubra TaxID=36100 RepID=UPI001EE55DB2|nr:uncharacterized protein LOC124266171 isoform X2 [Haliotis rubra]